MLNRAQLIGHVGADPEIRVTQNVGAKFASFSLATTEKWTDKATGEKRERTEWHRCVVWSEALIGVIEQYVKKGSKLYIEGKIQTREWHREGTPEDDRRFATEVVLNGFDVKLQLLDRPPANRPPMPSEEPDGPAKSARQASGGGQPLRPPPNGGAGDDDGRWGAPAHDAEIPF
jgi:single-strand DNA-binding protein